MVLSVTMTQDEDNDDNNNDNDGSLTQLALSLLKRVVQFQGKKSPIQVKMPKAQV